MDAIEVTVMMVLLMGTAAGLVTLGRRFWWHPSTGPVTVSPKTSAGAASSAADGTQADSRRGWLPAALAVATLLLVRRRRRRRRRAKD